MRKIIFIMVIALFSSQAFSSDIAFGTLKGIKVYDSTSSKVIKIYFNDDATTQLESCNNVANITRSQHDPEAIQQMMSIAMTAYIAGKKIRAYSSVDTCEADFIALQDSYF